jgi:hypothetical protein
MSRRKRDADYVARDRTSAIRRDPHFCIIIRSIWCRGERQHLALAELARRGLWLTEDQKRQAGIAQ